LSSCSNLLSPFISGLNSEKRKPFMGYFESKIVRNRRTMTDKRFLPIDSFIISKKAKMYLKRIFFLKRLLGGY
jgi:hypothetical protein